MSKEMKTNKIYKEMTKDKFKGFVMTNKNKLMFPLNKAEENEEFKELIEQLVDKPMTLLFSDKKRIIQYRMQVEKEKKEKGEDHPPARYVNKTYSDVNEEAIDVLYGDVLWANMEHEWVTLIFDALQQN